MAEIEGETLPCPFCGTKRISPFTHLDLSQHTDARGHHCAQIFCNVCGAAGPVIEYGQTENKDLAQELAIAAWSKRVLAKVG